MKDILRNYNVFIDGRGQFGKAMTIELPKLKLKTEEYRGAGMDLPIDVDLGMEKLEATMVFGGMSKEYYTSFGLGPGKIVPFTARGALASENGEKTVCIIHMRGKITELDDSTWEVGKLVQPKLTINMHFYKRIHGRTTVIQIEAETGDRIINGTNVNGWIRDALALPGAT